MSWLFPAKVAWAYFRSAQTQSRSLRFIARGAMIGLALSLTILIITLSVMNGFERDLRKKLLSKSPHIMAMGTHDIAIPLASMPDILSIERSYQVRLLLPQNHFQQIYANLSDSRKERLISTAIFSANQLPNPVQFVGIKSAILQQITQFALSDFRSFSDPSPLILLPIEDFENIKDFNPVKTQGFWLKDPFAVDRVTHALKSEHPFIKFVTWKDQYQSFFEALSGEKRLISLVLGLLIVLIYVQFALTLVLIFHDKKQDLIVLDTCCSDKKTVYRVFFSYGAYNVFVGTSLGVAVGAILAFILPEIVFFFEQSFDFKLLPYQHYASQTLPSEILKSDLLYTTFFALSLGLLTSHALAVYAQRRARKERLYLGAS